VEYLSDAPPTTKLEDDFFPPSTSTNAEQQSSQTMVRSKADASAISYDGRFFYNLLMEGTRLTNIQVMDTLPTYFEMNILPDALLGIDVLSTPATLADLLADPGAEVLGKALVGGVECWEVGGPAFPNHSGDQKNRLHIFLDPERDHLPRRVIVHTDGVDYVGGDRGSWFLDLEIGDFTKVIDGLTGEERWFPSHDVLRQSVPNEISLVVQKVRINGDLDDGLFHPAIDDRVEILDARSDGTGNVYIGTSQEALDRHIDRLADEARAETLRRSNPNSGFPLGIVLVALIAGGLLSVLILYRRSSR
jgi:hypothetical protein